MPDDLARRLQRLPRTLRPLIHKVEVLSELVQAAHATVDARRVSELIVARLGLWLPLPTWAVLVDKWFRRPRVMASVGLAEEWVPVVQTVAGNVFATGADWLAGSVRSALEIGPDVAAVALPLASRGQTRAAVVGFDSRPSGSTPRFTGNSRALLALGLDPLADALDSALRIQRAEALSVTDDLTQLFNARFLGQALRRETKRGVRTARPLSLLFLDLDGFKTVNDRHGHVLGSRALYEAAQVFRRCARETDVVARYGGDEFAVVLPETDVAGALAVATRIRERVAAHRFLESQRLRVQLTVSIGVATLEGGAGSPEDLVRAADGAMYRVKACGKNGIQVAPPIVAPPTGGAEAGQEHVR